MLWNVIYEFFVRYIFGGYYGSSVYEPLITYYDSSIDDYYNGSICEFNALTIKSIDGSINYYLNLGNYLSLIATIITLVVILVICCKVIKGIYNQVAHLLN